MEPEQSRYLGRFQVAANRRDLHEEKNPRNQSQKHKVTLIFSKKTVYRLYIVIEEKIFVYHFRKIKIENIIKTGPNPLGLCEISQNNDDEMIIYPAADLEK